jgi:flavin reductase (DIM6/NTAB) family NADH-FMN oxidoreductase RutF
MAGLLAELEMTIDPAKHDPRNIYRLMIGTIVPRPIAFVSTISEAGVLNLAPFSFFTGVSPNPPVVCFSPTRRGDGTKKDTLLNIEATREFVVNIVTEAIAGPMNACSAEFPPEVDEFSASGLTPVPSEVVKPPRVKESPVSMECRLIQVVELGQLPLSGNLVIGEIVRFHVDDAIVSDFRIDPDKLLAVGRMGGIAYTRTRDRFNMERPVV